MPTPQPTRAGSIARAFFIAALTSALAGSFGCLSTPGPLPLDLTNERALVAREALRLERIDQVLGRDLGQLTALRKSFEDAPPGLYASPFPLDLFKHVALECFNEPWEPRPAASQSLAQSSSQPEAPVVSSIDEAALSCKPEFIGRLMHALYEQEQSRRVQAIGKLQTLDELRQVRGTLRVRIHQMPAVLFEASRTLAQGRADLRRMRDAEARRRTEYSSENWQQAQARLDAFEQELHALEVNIQRLTEARPTWNPQIDAEVALLYASLTTLAP